VKFLKGGLLASVAVSALAVTFAASAQEQVNPDKAVTERTPEGYEPNGITVGSFRLYPKAEVSEEYIQIEHQRKRRLHHQDCTGFAVAVELEPSLPAV
jgi:hypothetical protein